MNYTDIKLKQYLALKDMAKESDDLDMLTIQAREIAICNDMTEDEVLGLSLPEYTKKVQEISFLSTPIKPRKHLPSQIVIDGKKYKVENDVRKMTIGQFIDYNSLRELSNDDTYLPQILGVFVYPADKEYLKGYDADTNAEALKEGLDIQTAVDISFFFRSKLETYLRSMLLILGWEIKKMERKKTMSPEKMKEVKEKMQALRSILNGNG